MAAEQKQEQIADHVNLPAATPRTDELIVAFGYLDRIGLDVTLALPAPNDEPHARRASGDVRFGCARHPFGSNSSGECALKQQT